MPCDLALVIVITMVGIWLFCVMKKIWLAPIYDFARMRADPEGIIHSTTWSCKGELPQEFAGEYRFDLIAELIV